MTRLLDAWPHAVQEGQLPDGRVDDPVHDDLLHLVQDRLAALAVQLGRLLPEQAVQVRVAAVDEEPAVDEAVVVGALPVLDRRGGRDREGQLSCSTKCSCSRKWNTASLRNGVLDCWHGRGFLDPRLMRGTSPGAGASPAG